MANNTESTATQTATTAAVPTVSIKLNAAQYAAARMLSLKYKGVSPQQMAEKLMNQILKSYLTNDAKAAKTKSGDRYDMAVESGVFEAKMTRAEYVAKEIATYSKVLSALKLSDDGE